MWRMQYGHKKSKMVTELILADPNALEELRSKFGWNILK